MKSISRHNNKTMKKQLFKTLVILFGLTLLSSCMKDDPEYNATVYYGYQQIPNINEFMPQSLLSAMGENNIYYGDEPPKIEGTFIADSIYCTTVFCAPWSNWSAIPTNLDGTYRFDITDQHIGIANLYFSKYAIDSLGVIYYDQISSSDSIDLFLKDYINQFINDTLIPSYFKNSQNDLDVFNKIYIIGRNPYFTIYYYDIKSYLQTMAASYNIYKPLFANIISGKLDKINITEIDSITGTPHNVEKTVITDFIWGCQTVKYLNKDAINTMVYNYHSFPKEGDGRLLITKVGYVPQVENQ